jgi:NitT/TauT family transport system permease protein
VSDAPRGAGAPRSHRLRDGLAVAGVALLLLAVWQAIVIIGGYPPFILPGPLVVGARLVRAIGDGTIAPHLATTLGEVLLGLAAGVAAALVLGVVLARSRVADRVLSPWLVAAQATPILALAPLIVLWFGSGLGSKVLICALICFFPMVVATTVGLRSIDPRLVELAHSLRASRRQLILTVEVPAALPQILGGLKVAATLAVVGAIVAEWVGGDKGLGVLINLARGSLFDIPLMFATLVVIATVGVVLYLSVVFVEHRVTGARTQ